jgi:intraflagellar transport protein 140
VNLGEIRDASVNCKGNVIIFLIDSMVNSEMRVPETKFILFDIEMDSFVDYEISPNRIPTEVMWDSSDQRIFGIQTEYAKDISDEKPLYNIEDPLGKENNDFFGPEFYIDFYTSEYGIHNLETHKIQRDLKGAFGIEIPNIYFVSSSIDAYTNSSIQENKFQFFQGLERIDDVIKSSLVEFTILMSCGKLDEAYKIVKNIKSENIWENMAHICIKTKRLDVLEVCLSNM